MQRLIEQPSGEGEVLTGTVRIGRVHYHLAVYQHFSDVENEPVPESFEVEGRVVPVSAADRVEVLDERHRELTLRLADGRTLEFRIVDPTGAIRSTGRSFRPA